MTTQQEKEVRLLLQGFFEVLENTYILEPRFVNHSAQKVKLQRVIFDEAAKFNPKKQTVTP